MLNASTKSNVFKREFVETYHRNHNILSFDAAEDQQQTQGGIGGCLSIHNTFCSIFLRQYLIKVIFFINVEIV